MTTIESRLSISWHTITVTREPLAVEDRGHLASKPDVCVPIGSAPDGLPLVLRVSRSASIIEPVLRALHAGDIRHLSSDVRKLVHALNQRVQNERKELGVLPRGPHSDTPHYVSMATVPTLFGDTLLARLLGTMSPLLLPEDAWTGALHHNALACRTSAGVLMPAVERQQLQQDLNTNQRLAIPLDDAPVSVVRDDGHQNVDMASGRPLLVEDLRRMKSARFHGYRRIDGETRVAHFHGELGDNDAYRSALRKAEAVGWSVTRGDLLRMIVDVARSLAPLHKAGLVHGDIKASNVLITDDGATAHDSLDIKAGAVSAAGTRGWNAPEQIIARPTSPATDVFALAQLVVKVLEAAVFGDERSFVVPVGGGQRVRERLLAEPDVYLDPNLIPMNDAAIEAWRTFLRRCLALDADQRLQSADAFADTLAELTERHPISGRRVVSGLAGRLVRQAKGEGLLERLRAIGGDDADAVVWMLEDSYAFARATPWSIARNEAAE